MVSDVITAQYECKFRLWADDPREVKGYWLYAPPGALDLPVPPVIRPLAWTDDPIFGSEYYGAIGEVPNSRRRISGTPPPVHGDGRHFCGKKEWFTEGKRFGKDGPDNLARNPDGSVACCGASDCIKANTGPCILDNHGAALLAH